MWGRERTRGRRVRSSETTSRSSSSPPQLTLVHCHHLCLHESLQQPLLFHQLPSRGAKRGTIFPKISLPPQVADPARGSSYQDRDCSLEFLLGQTQQVGIVLAEQKNNKDIRRGVRSDAQLSCTETRFQKCS